MMELNKIYNLDCFDGLKLLPSDFVDLLVSDPPYQLSQKGSVKGFMGKLWDVLPSVSILKECLRVLKPGSFSFWLMTPRQDSQAEFIKRLGDAGFNIGFSPIYWAYASGFPKASNISKLVDKRPNRLELTEKIGKIIKQYRLKKGLNLRQLGELCDEPLYKIGGTVFFETESTKRLPTKKQWIKLKEVLNISDEYDELFEEAEREIVGQDGRNAKKSIFNIGIQKKWDLTVPKTEKAKLLDGSFGGFQPKPAVEVVVVGMKPLSEKSFVDQALKNKKGVTWLDDCRIPYESESDFDKTRLGNFKGGKGYLNDNQFTFLEGSDINTGKINVGGRFPANLLVSDDILNDGVNHVSGYMNQDIKGKQYNVYGKMYARHVETIGDSGSFSRYFSLDKWFINKLPKNVQSVFPFLVVPKASSSEKSSGLSGFKESCSPTMGGGIDVKEAQDVMKRNVHPTVKPIKLMSYLITLGSREGDLVLDPFVGSGTTCVSARLLSRGFIGFERDEEYFKIALARIKPFVGQKKLWDVFG